MMILYLFEHYIVYKSVKTCLTENNMKITSGLFALVHKATHIRC